MNPINGMVDAPQIGGEGCDLAHDFAELIQRKSVDRPQNRVREAPGRGQLKGKIFARAEAGIYGQYNR